eukprot:1306666-Amphidinium_carterae.4
MQSLEISPSHRESVLRVYATGDSAARGSGTRPAFTPASPLECANGGSRVGPTNITPAQGVQVGSDLEGVDRVTRSKPLGGYISSRLWRALRIRLGGCGGEARLSSRWLLGASLCALPCSSRRASHGGGSLRGSQQGFPPLIWEVRCVLELFAREHRSLLPY